MQKLLIWSARLSLLIQMHAISGCPSSSSWRIYNLPLLSSGLQALPLRPSDLKPAAIFQNKTLRGFLKLSRTSPTPSLYFLLGELPVEGKVHIATLSLFHAIWENHGTTVHQMVKYILMMCGSNSTTLSNHIQLLCLKYGLPSPLQLMSTPPWPKDYWKVFVTTKVTVYHETELRRLASNNSKMTYLNVQLSGLTGRPHPSLLNIQTTQDVRKLRPHLKFLAGDFLTAEVLASDQPNLSPACKLCRSPVESSEHVLVHCRATADVRQRIFPELLNIVAEVQPDSILLKNHNHPQLTQFILDCTSANLDDNVRIPAHNPGISKVFALSRDWCFSISNERARLLKNLKLTTRQINTLGK